MCPPRRTAVMQSSGGCMRLRATARQAEGPPQHAAASVWLWTRHWFDLCRSERIELRPWVERYVRRRYGPATPPSAGAAWQLLLESVYNSTDLHNDHKCAPHPVTQSTLMRVIPYKDVCCIMLQCCSFNQNGNSAWQRLPESMLCGFTQLRRAHLAAGA